MAAPVLISFAMKCSTPIESSIPIAPPAIPTTSHSTMCCRKMFARDAPSARRTDTSGERARNLPRSMPVIWDADLLYGPKTEAGEDTYVLCEINVSSVYPFPDSALGALAREVKQRLGRR